MSLERKTKFKNINGLVLPPLDFKDLPEYETTDDEEDQDDETSYIEANNPFNKTDADNIDLKSPEPHNRLDQYQDQSIKKKDNFE